MLFTVTLFLLSFDPDVLLRYFTVTLFLLSFDPAYCYVILLLLCFYLV